MNAPFLLWFSILVGCGGATQEASAPVAPVTPVAAPEAVVIQLDAAHRFVRGKGTPYPISQTDQLTLDLTQLDPRTDPDRGAPDAVHLFFGRGRLYRFAVSDPDRVELSASTAQALAGSEAWTGFPQGARATLSLGFETTPGVPQGFTPLWTGEIQVK